MSAPAFQQIKDHVLAQINAGAWGEGEAIPSEAALGALFGVSRMTVNRAIRELQDERVVERVQGSGTFVAQQQKYQSTLVEIRNIADEIAARGHTHRAQLHLLERCVATPAQAAHFQLHAKTSARKTSKPSAAMELFHSVVVHFENDIAIQVEDRYVNPAVAPDYLHMNFAQQTPNAYLTQVAPITSAQFAIEAAVADARIAAMLHIAQGAPCLVLHRSTMSQRVVASSAQLWHPATRYQFTGGF